MLSCARFIPIVICLFFLPLLTAVRVSADVLLFDKVSVDDYSLSLHGSSMTADQKPTFNNFVAAPFGDSTLYASKSDVCVANPLYSIVVHKDSSGIVYFPLLKQYMAVDKEMMTQASALVSSSLPQPSARDRLQCAVTDLHKSETIVGCLTHKYHFRVGTKDNSLWADGDIWLSDDFPELKLINSTPLSTNEWINLVLRKVKGVPFKVTCALHQQSGSPLHLLIDTTAVLTHDLPAISFEPPHGFSEIKTDRAHCAMQLKDAINHSFFLMLARSSTQTPSLRSYGVYTGPRKRGVATVIGNPETFEGRLGAAVKVVLVSSANDAKGVPASDLVLTTYTTHADAAGAPVYEEVSTVPSSGAASRVTMRYSHGQITLDQYSGEMHTHKVISVPIGLNVYSLGDYTNGFVRLEQPNLGWLGVGGILDTDSMTLRLCKVSVVALDATLKDSILGNRSDLTEISIESGPNKYVLYEDSDGDVLYADLPGSVSVRREIDQPIAHAQHEIPQWFQLPDATDAVQNDVRLPDPRTCKNLVAEVKEPGKDAVLLRIQSPAVIDHGGDLSEVRASKDLSDWLSNSKFMSLDSPTILRQAQQIRGDSHDLYEIASRTCDWVYNAMTYSPETLLADNRPAEKILKSRVGICRDYAVLYTALARAEGLPTRLCSGFVAVGDGKFAYHEWAETYVGHAQGWIAVDPSFDQHIADATHIRVEYGDDSTPSGTKVHIYSIIKP